MKALTLRKNLKRIEIAAREPMPYITRDLLYAFLIAIALHVLPISLFTIKKLYFSYSAPIIQSITIAPSLHQLQISTDAPHFPAPPLPTHESINLPPIHPGSISHLLMSNKPSKTYSLSPHLQERLQALSLIPNTSFVKIDIKIDDKTGKIFYYDAHSPISKELHQWLMSLNFDKIPGSFATNGIIELDTGRKHD